MKKASLLVNEFEQGVYDAKLAEVYADESLVAGQVERYIGALNKFTDLYEDQKVAIFSTPGRSEVCGNHTDHQNGQVLAAAINLDIIAVVSKNNQAVKVVSDNYDLSPIELSDLAKRVDELETSEGLIRGTLARFKELNYNIGGFYGYMTSDVLQGSGLSSSAAFEVMIGTILSGLYNEMRLDPVTIAKIGQYSENVYFGKPCGLMDQCACSVGSLISIDFKDKEHPKVTKVDKDFSKYNNSLCIVDVNASHADLTSDYAAIPDEMKKVAAYFGQDALSEVNEDEFYSNIQKIREITGDRAVLRAIHLFNENKRVVEAVAALNNDDFHAFKLAVAASGESSFKYLQNIYSNNYVENQAVSLALALSEMILGDQGVCRVHGGGFAGTIQAFVQNDFVSKYKMEMDKYFGPNACHILKIRSFGGIQVV